MGQRTPVPHLVESDNKTNDLFVIFGTLGDTTWRMFVPSIGFTLLGAWLDSQFATKPWYMIAGIIVGVFGALMLVRKQLKMVKRRDG